MKVTDIIQYANWESLLFFSSLLHREDEAKVQKEVQRKMTNKYEAAIVLSVANGEEATNALKDKFNDLIAKHGTVENVDDWGKRRLAYLINDESEGYYVFFTFTSEPDFPAELERIAKITDGVLRAMVIRK